MEKRDAEFESKENRINWMEFNDFEWKNQTAPHLGYGAVFIKNSSRKTRVIIINNSRIFRL